MSLLAWQKIADQKEEVENQIKNINNQIMSLKLQDELGQIKFTKMFQPVTSRLDTQIEATKKLENKGVKEGDPLPEYPDPLPEYPSEQEDDIQEYEMPTFEPPTAIDEDEDEYEKRKRKEWSPSSINKSKQKELDNERKYLAEERRRVNVLLGKLNKSGKNYVKTGKYQGLSYDDLLKQSDNFTKQINNIEDQLLLTKQKIQRIEYKRVPFTSFDLQERSKKLKKTPKSKSKIKSKPTIVKSLFDKIEGMRRDTAPDSDREDDEWYGSGYDQNYKVIYYNNPEKLIGKLNVICGTIRAGNSSNEVRNQGVIILDELLRVKRITKRLYEKIYNNYFI